MYREVVDWIADNNIGVMNVAGPRESSSPGIAKKVEAFLVKALRAEFQIEDRED